MKIIDKIYLSPCAPRNKNVLWLDKELNLHAYLNGWKEVNGGDGDDGGDSGGGGSSEEVYILGNYPSYPQNVFKKQNFEEGVSQTFKLAKYIAVKYRWNAQTISDFMPFSSYVPNFLYNHVTSVTIFGVKMNLGEALNVMTKFSSLIHREPSDYETEICFELDTDVVEGDLFGHTSSGYNSGELMVPFAIRFGECIKEIKNVIFPYLGDGKQPIGTIDLSNTKVTELSNPFNSKEEGKMICFSLLLPECLEFISKDVLSSENSLSYLYFLGKKVPSGDFSDINYHVVNEIYYPLVFDSNNELVTDVYSNWLKDMFNRNCVDNAYAIDMQTSEFYTTFQNGQE